MDGVDYALRKYGRESKRRIVRVLFVFFSFRRGKEDAEKLSPWLNPAFASSQKDRGKAYRENVDAIVTIVANRGA